MTSMFRILGLTALLVLGSVPLFAQTALNQVYLTSAVTSADTTTVALSAADSVAANDVLFLDEEAMTAVTCNATTDICTVRRGQMGTRAEGHLNRAVVWTGTGAQFYYYDPPAGGRCVKANAYPGNREPWINVLTGNISACIQTFGTGTTVAGYWERANLGMAGAGRLAYRAIFYPTSRTSDALVITPALTVNFWDSLVASLTYTGPFEVFLPNPTGLLGKQITISDFARLNTNASTSTAGRTMTIRGLFENGDNTITLARWEQFEAQPGFTTARLSGVGASTRFYVGITASSIYYWFAF